jgi:hypothetical protein
MRDVGSRVQWWMEEASDDRISVGGADPCEHASVYEQRFGACGDVWQLLRGCPCPHYVEINQSTNQSIETTRCTIAKRVLLHCLHSPARHHTWLWRAHTSNQDCPETSSLQTTDLAPQIRHCGSMPPTCQPSRRSLSTGVHSVRRNNLSAAAATRPALRELRQPATGRAAHGW